MMYHVPWAVPYSSKRKKEQLRATRERRKQRYAQQMVEMENDYKADMEVLQAHGIKVDDNIDFEPKPDLPPPERKSYKIRPKKEKEVTDDVTAAVSLETILFNEDDIKAKKQASHLPIDLTKRKDYNEFDDSYKNYCCVIDSEPLDTETIPFPVRPHWDYDMKAAQVDANEREYFTNWLQKTKETFGKRLNYFETNIEVWRQLWRVCERSDILLQVLDGRYPLFHFSSEFHHYVTKELNKPMIIVMTKADLTYAETLSAWQKYFLDKFNIVATCISSKLQFVDQIDDGDIFQLRKEINKTRTSENITDVSSGLDNLMKAIEETAGSLKSLIKPEHITVGLVGDPNAGKSSLINALRGKHVVSVSKQPGHTKHFQTIILRQNLVLCDCPGMIFPAVDRDKNLQILCGLYPISRLREPFSALRYAAERLPIEKIFKLEEFNIEPNAPWSPFSLAAANAQKHQQFKGRVGLPDAHRGALGLLNDLIEGYVRFCWGPPALNIQMKPEENAKLLPSNDINQEFE